MVLTLIAGIGFFLYPDIASWWNGRIQAGFIDEHQISISEMQQTQIDAQLQRAMDFNAAITEINISDPFADIATLPEEYMRTLNIQGIMATIDIPVVNISMPIRHGTGSDVLYRGAGHLAGTHFPIGGESTHSVITAHSGLSNARMFTDILNNNLYIGDYFFINVLDQRLAYQVVRLDTVYPHEVELISISPGEDLVTLITCTPLAVNTYRLLVRGIRVPYVDGMAEDIVSIISVFDTNWRIFVTLALFLLFLLIFAIYQLVRIIRGRLKKAEKLALEIENDPYVTLPPTPEKIAREKAAAAARQRRREQRRKAGEMRRKTAIAMALVMIVGGASVVLFPRVQRVLHTRYVENLIRDWEDGLEDAREFIRTRWINERTSLWTAVSDLPVAENGGLRVGPSGNIYSASFGGVGPGGEVYNNGGFYIGPSGNMYIGNLTIHSNGEPFTIGSDGYLSVGGNVIGNNGSISVGNLSVNNGGNLYINGAAGSDPILGTGGGGLTINDLSMMEDFSIYIGDIYLGDLTTESIEDLIDYFDLNFVFNFDLSQDPMYWLYQQTVDYNYGLYETDQQTLTPESMEEVDFSVTQQAGFSEEMLGFITIPRLDYMRLPIFAGSNDANKLRGAAHMSHTSLPVGGISTNSVITAHRGLSRAVMFRDIDLLQNGDKILITNFYQTLTYIVVGYDIIEPIIGDIYPITIREGIDMITLLTCHPYRRDAERLLVFAERCPQDLQS